MAKCPDCVTKRGTSWTTATSRVQLITTSISWVSMCISERALEDISQSCRQNEPQKRIESPSWKVQQKRKILTITFRICNNALPQFDVSVDANLDRALLFLLSKVLSLALLYFFLCRRILVLILETSTPLFSEDAVIRSFCSLLLQDYTSFNYCFTQMTNWCH